MNTSIYTKLHRATAENDVARISRILSTGIDPNLCLAGDTWNALHIAIEHESWDALDILLRHGGVIDSQDIAGSTLLHHLIDVEADAAHQLEFELTQTNVGRLLGLGANPLIANNEGQTPLQMAKEWEHMPAVKVLSD